MTRTELENKITELGFTYNFHQAMSGSQYIRVDGVQFRVSDHKQPSHYQVRNYISVGSIENGGYDNIINIVCDPEFNKKEKEYTEINGIKHEVVYCDKTDSFQFFPVN